MSEKSSSYRIGRDVVIAATFATVLATGAAMSDGTRAESHQPQPVIDDFNPQLPYRPQFAKEVCTVGRGVTAYIILSGAVSASKHSVELLTLPATDTPPPLRLLDEPLIRPKLNAAAWIRDDVNQLTIKPYGGKPRTIFPQFIETNTAMIVPEEKDVTLAVGRGPDEQIAVAISCGREAIAASQVFGEDPTFKTMPQMIENNILTTELNLGN